MITWNVYITNDTDKGAGEPLITNVTIFQMNRELTANCYSSAWKVLTIQPGARAGPIPISDEVELAVLYKDEDIPMRSPLQSIKAGQTALVTQLKSGGIVKVEISGQPDPSQMITAINNETSVDPLGVAFYKDRAKLISFKGVNPNEAVTLQVTRNIYLTNNEEFVEGQDFDAAVQVEEATKFPLLPSKLDMSISIVRKASGKVEFKAV